MTKRRINSCSLVQGPRPEPAAPGGAKDRRFFVDVGATSPWLRCGLSAALDYRRRLPYVVKAAVRRITGADVSRSGGSACARAAPYQAKGDGLRAYHMLLLLALAAIWGGSYIFIRVASPVFGPSVLMECRVAIAFPVLWGYAGLHKYPLRFRELWKKYLLIGVIGGAVPFTLIAFGELYIPASLASILNATTPLFSTLVAAMWLHEALTVARGLGLVLGIAGVTMLVGWSPLPITPHFVLAVAVMLMAALSYAVGGAYASRAFSGVPSVSLAAGQQFGAAAALLPFAAISLPEAHFTWIATANLAALALASTGLAYLIYYPLLRAVGPTRTLSVTFLIPIFGVLWGVVFLHEAVHLTTILGLVVILSGVMLIAGVANALAPQLKAGHGVWLRRVASTDSKE